MKPDFQIRIQRYGWDKAAAHYEPYWQQPLRPAQERLLEAAALRPGERVLDVACGTGLVTFPAAAAVSPEGSVLGTDLSGEMIEAARRLAGERGIENTRFERMGAEDLAVPEASFDVALCALGLMYVPDPLRAVREMHRVLVPGGRAAVLVWGVRSRCGWAEVFPIVDARVASDVCPMFFQQGTGDTLRRTFEAAGFEAVTLDRFTSVLHFDTAEQACGAAFAGGPVALAWARFDAPTRAEASAEYLASIAPYRDGPGYAIPGEFVVAVGRRPG